MEQVFKQLNVRKVINASGRMTHLGVSTISDETVEAIKYGGQNYVHMEELIEITGKKVAQLLKAEEGIILSSAASGIALAIASLIHEGNQKYIQNPLKAITDFKIDNEIILLKGQNIDFGAPIETMIQLGGGKVVEAGWANKCSLENIKDVVSERTKGILFVKSHHTVQKSMPSLLDINKLAKELKIPLIIDAAAEENLTFYSDKLKADIVIFSGAKAIEGPTSGLVVGKKHLIANIKKEIYGIGRAMKIGKENIYGQVEALNNYLKNYANVNFKNWNQKLLVNFVAKINEIKYLNCEIEKERSERMIERAKLTITKNSKFDIHDFVTLLEKDSPSIVTRNHRKNEGIIYFDPRPIRDSDYEIIIDKIKKIVRRLNNELN